ncbi:MULTISPECIES: acetoacetate--CoA ligase [unclassified Bradyrhizobium]|uniref:acetoacetate--CoA ligase n=1 Tax=unclassified Bradyrhizobium TaxID=2631580 RepID=UPI0028EA9C60|nr:MULTISPECIES: acetoacetate--CoA ligase [unclassified Bradyrhizobium]
MTQQGELLWEGTDEYVASSNISKFVDWLKAERGLHFGAYNELWQWSATEVEDFWQAIWDYFRIHSITPPGASLVKRTMPGAEWFPGALVNFTEHVLRHANDGDPDRPFLFHKSELRPLQTLSWAEVVRDVQKLATELRRLGVRPGDRVAAYMPNIAETVLAMLATAAVGGIWSTAAPEFGASTVIDRFTQTRPKVLFVADGYRYGGKDFDRTEQIRAIVASLESVETVVWLDYLTRKEELPNCGRRLVRWPSLFAGEPVASGEFEYQYVPGDHPLWILFSSGTTGLPKPIVHGHLGILLEHYKSAAFHLNLKPGSVMCFYTTTGWMMWNTLMWAPLMNGAAVLYDGHPTFPDAGMLLGLAAETGAQSLGTSPTSVQLMAAQHIVPKDKGDFSPLENIFLVGSPATPETFAWLYEHVKPNLWVTSQSGGTEFCSGLVAGVPSLPVYAGEIQARALGVDLHAYGENGEPLIGTPGELVIRKPMPSMPLFLWGDVDSERYRASYFDVYPGVWCHGDRITITERGSCIVHGRSDATLNRFGVRIGSAEIYRTLEQIEGVADSLVVCIEEENGGYFMPLFVRLVERQGLDEKLIARIKARLREERSPRHVPDVVIEAPDIPYTLTGKKMEIPVRKLLMGQSVEASVNLGSMRNPEAIDWYASFSNSRREAKSKESKA